MGRFFSSDCTSIVLLQSLKTQREAKFAEIKLTILSFLEVLESEPENSFERQVVCEPEDMFILSADNMDAVEKYLEKLEKNVEVRSSSLCWVDDWN